MTVTRRALPGLFVALLVAGLGARAAPGAQRDAALPPPRMDNPKAAGPLQTAVLAGGCFWGVQGVYQHVRGVLQVVSGYAGGERETAQYEWSAPAVPITPRRWRSVSIRSLVHDPTQLNRQGPDEGTQYRSAIFFVDGMQQRIATAYIEQLQKTAQFGGAIVTQVVANSGFHPAEAYHQDYLVNNPNEPYIALYDRPKIEDLRWRWPDFWREQPVTLTLQ